MPLTLDLASVRQQLEDSVIGLAGQETAIGDTIALATKRLRGQPAEQRVLVLLTDGVNTAGLLEPKKAAEIAKAEGVRMAVVDAVSNADLLRLGPALKGMPLVTAGSGVAIGLPGNFGVTPSNEAARLPAAQGLQAIVSGSCSVATNQQVMDFIKAGKPALAIDPLRIAAGVDVAAEALAWAEGHIGNGPVLVYSTAEPSAVRAIQGKLGSEKAGAMVEDTIAAIARGLVQRGVRQLIVAGGETSGACVQALGVTQMRIGAQIDPGVPWCHAVAPDAKDGLHITLKSGNFGSTDFFTKAFAQLQA